MTDEPTPALHSDERAARKRLDSWKEIAAHFGRDVRTVKRWEKDEGLPVHRHVHKTLASVYAYEDELEPWQKNRRQRGEPTEEAAPRRRAHWIGWTLATVVVLAAGATYWLRRPPALPFQERDWALIARFENRTGEPVFDGSVEYAVERELTNSKFVNVVPRERVVDALRLMKKPPETVVDRSVGREVCLRDGGIRALITGRVEKLGGRYIVSADLVDPATDVAVRSFSEEAGVERDVVRAIARLSDRVREGLGEELSFERIDTAAAGRLERVSTPSLRALQLYSQGDALIREHKLREAAAMLREAAREDAGFASAHVLLAHALGSLGNEAEARAHFQRACELAETTTDRERLFILASCQQRFDRDPKKATETLELLLRLDPDHYWATSNLMMAYQSQNRLRDAVPYVVRRADLRPNNFDHQLRAAHALVLSGDTVKADEYAGRARGLVAAETADSVRPWRVAWVRLFPAHTKWVRGDLQGALEEVRKAAAEIDSKTPADRLALQWEIGLFHLVLGRQRDAALFLADMSGSPENTALIALISDDVGRMKKHLQIARGSHRTAILLARAGLPSEAEKALEHPEVAQRAYAPFLPSVWNALARGEVAFARRQHSEAIPLLEEATRRLRGWPTSYFFLGVDSLSRAWEEEGEPARSIAELEGAAPHGKASIFWGPAPLFWMKNELRRADLYRSAGRETEAQAIEETLVALLAVADADFPIVQELRRRGGRASALK